LIASRVSAMAMLGGDGRRPLRPFAGHLLGLGSGLRVFFGPPRSDVVNTLPRDLGDLGFQFGLGLHPPDLAL
jgi:hypothetical protein